jgi:hypothetical protein
MHRSSYTYRKKQEERPRLNSRQPSFFNLNQNDGKYEYGFKQFEFNAPQIKATENLSPIKTPENNFQNLPKTQLNTTWYLSTEQRLQEENKKLREELITIRESFLKEKETLLNKIDKKNDIIYELNSSISYYSDRNSTKN